MKIEIIQIERDEVYLKKFVKVREAAEILGVSRKTVYNRMNDNKLQYTIDASGEKMFYRAQVEALKVAEGES